MLERLIPLIYLQEGSFVTLLNPRRNYFLPPVRIRMKRIFIQNKRKLAVDCENTVATGKLEFLEKIKNQHDRIENGKSSRFVYLRLIERNFLSTARFLLKILKIIPARVSFRISLCMIAQRMKDKDEFIKEKFYILI